MLFMGLDVGTQGVRCAVADEKGAVAAAKSVAFARLNAAEAEGLYEQDARDWERAAEEAVLGCVAQLKMAGRAAEEIHSLSIDGTSGTVLAVDASGKPLMRALMYNDPRAKEEAALCHALLAEHEEKLGLRFNASFSLPRLLWIKNQLPDIYGRAGSLIHQADYVGGLFDGDFAVSDYSNALKTGYDLIDGRWPEKITGALGIDKEKLPRVVAPGAPRGYITKAAAARFQLSTKTLVTGGSTDGYASALAAGAVRAGSWALILGTTFVLKGVTEKLVIDPDGSSYSHRLPSGEWLLGGASNLGGRCLNAVADKKDFKRLDEQSEALVPTGARCYPLTGVGERFPFLNFKAEPFYLGNILGGRLYPALMEGVGFAERYALERMEKLGCKLSDSVCATGGACRSDIWLRIRASILNRRLLVPAAVDAAMGSALLAACAHFGSLPAAAAAMIRYEKTVEPNRSWTGPYEEIYKKFREDLAREYGAR